VAYDGYLDFYHLPILHKNTFGPQYNNKTVNDAWGPHQRNTQPDERMLGLADQPDDEWPITKINGGIWTVFPHVSIAGFDAGGRLYMVSQLFPGDTPDTSVTTQHFLATFEPDAEQLALIDKQMDFLLRVVRDEDYYTGNRIQRAVKTGAKTEFLFGRNEGSCQRFHGWVDVLVSAETASTGRARGVAAAATETDDWVAILAEFENGASGVLESSKLASGRNESWRSLDYVEINGSEASFEFTTGRWNELLHGRKGGPGLAKLEVPREFWVWPGSPRDPGVGDPLVSFRYDQAVEFINAIREQRACSVTFHDGARAQAVMDAAVRSAETREWIQIS
jgi:hypothetical protein